MTSSKQQLVRVSLFRGTDHARAAIKDLMCVGVPPELIRMIGGSGNSDTTIGGIKKALGIAERDARSLTDCVERGGIVSRCFFARCIQRWTRSDLHAMSGCSGRRDCDLPTRPDNQAAQAAVVLDFQAALK